MHWAYCRNSSFFMNFRVDMASFVDLSHKVIAKRRSAFWALSSAQNESESKGEDKTWRINTNFHKWKEIWIFFLNLKPIPI